MGVIGLDGLINTTEQNADTSTGSIDKGSTASVKSETYTEKTSTPKVSSSKESAGILQNRLGQLFTGTDFASTIGHREWTQGDYQTPYSGSTVQARLRNILGRYRDSLQKGTFKSGH